MTYILTETSAGYALLKAKDKKIHKSDNLVEELNTPEKVAAQFKVKAFSKFESAAAALEEVNAIVEAKVSDKLSNLLSEALKDEKKTSLVVADPKLGNAINKLPNLNISVVSDSQTLDLYRAIRENLPELLPGLTESDLSTMSLGLAHSLGRYKLKFSADKVDTMIVQAISLLDDLDKELNTYAMRVKEWYGWHFPEMAKIVQDNIAYARVIKAMGYRSNAKESDLSAVLPEEVEQQLKEAAEVSMGTEITQFDLENIQSLADQVIEFSEYREQLSSYLNARMAAIAPNLTALVGELVGARLIAHAGSLISLAKAPASTVQILGAEKALFRALKTKHDTPKYGIIYHASLIGQATGKNKGKIARMLAAKASVSLRYDALAEDREDVATVGIDDRVKLEKRLSALEGREISTTRPAVNRVQQQKVELVESKSYNADADTIIADASMADSDDEEEEEEEEVKKEKKKEKKEKKEKKDKKEKKEKKEKKDKKRKRDEDEDEEDKKKKKKEKKEKKKKD
ncbi:nucleolar protein 58 [Trichomonascus vanleenenianus]|uniref:RNA-processing protein NOP58 n=1 Tax=Trichomonascus vanleenenianus TaxID=2268995 RepID=UPI003ECB6911